jgi:hypothetical protein
MKYLIALKELTGGELLSIAAVILMLVAIGYGIVA